MRSPENTLVFRPRVLPAADSLRPTRAEIDLGAIAANLAALRAICGKSRILAVVKADGYGHGVVPVALRLQQEGADGFGVALAEEGLELREAGITTDILVLNGVYGGAHGEVLAAGLTPVVYDVGQVQAFRKAAAGRPFGVHLKVDTGMSRLGVPDRELAAFLDRFAKIPGARIAGLMTHFASADTDDEQTKHQLARFARARRLVRARGHRPKVIHAANSAATLRHPEARFDLVRPGLALFGHSPIAGRSFDQLRPAMRLRSEVIAVRDLAAGETVGYGATFRAERATRIATVPVGYGDGLLRSTSNRGTMLLKGVRCPIVGNVSMDLTTLDVTALPCAIGDEVVLLGAQGGEQILAEEVATAAGTIPYEVLTNVSRRVPRFYT